MRKTVIFATLVAVLMLCAGKESLFAQRGGGGGTQEMVEVKIASPLPQASPWGRTLDKIAAEWSRITNGQVRLRVLHNGIEGGESKMQLSLASNTIQAALFTSFGLSSINPSIMTMSAPFLIRNEEEFDVVMKEVQGDLESRFNSGDYFIVAWSKAGFVNIFSKDPVFTPDDLRKMKIASNAEASEMNTAFMSMGFNVVDVDWNDVGPKLNAGAISAVYQIPAAVAALQLHSHMKNMLSVNFAPIMGGIVMNQVTWKKIGALNPRYQQELLKVTRQIAADFDISMQKAVTNDINTMVKKGLKVNRPTPVQEQLWYSEIERAMPALMEGTYDRQLYQKISQILTKHRRGQ